MKNLSFIGAGYVGLCNGVGFANLGHKVTVMDINKEKIRMINSGKSQIDEEGLEEKLKKVIEKKLLVATCDVESAIENSDVTFICVQTPTNLSGSINLKFIINSSKEIGKAIRKKEGHLIVLKSTVIPNTTEKVVIPIIERYSDKKAGKHFGICMSPEFFSEGNALRNFFNPDRIVIGQWDKKSGDILEEVYSTFDEKIPRLRVDLKTAEMIKCASNAFIGMKISFSNEIGNICRKFGIDGRTVMKGVALDRRFSEHFMKPGISFGGPCLEKDVTAMITEAKDKGYNSILLKSIIEMNQKQENILLNLINNKIREYKLNKIGILGLSYKSNISDIRGSQSIEILTNLKNSNYDIYAYDPKSEDKMYELHPEINYKPAGQEVVDNSDLILILNYYEEFEDLNYEDKIVIDGTGITKIKKCREYEGICW